MKLSNFVYIASFAIAAGWSILPSASAGTVSHKDGATTWHAGFGGIVVKWGKDGKLERMYSTKYQPVAFNDRQGISTAYKVAELKADAAIVKFLKQSVKSSQVYHEMESDLSVDQQRSQNGGATSNNKVDSRNLASSFQNTISSYAQGDLSGVIVLERGYDANKSEVWVTVGISKKTVGTARNMQNMLNKDSSGGERPAQGGVNSNNIKKAPSSEFQRSPNYGNF